MALLARRGRFEPAAVSEELARAAAEAEAGQPDRARKRYAKLAKSLASAPDELRPARRAALIGGADLHAEQGDVPAAIPLYQQAFALSADPSRELPRLALRRLALHRMQVSQGPLAAPLAFLRAAAQPQQVSDAAPTTPAAPVEDAESVAQVAGWLQHVCGQGSIAARDEATAQAVAGLPGWDWPVLARASVLMAANRRPEAEQFLAGAAPSGSGEVWFRWAAVLIAAGRFPQAVAAFDEALRRGAPADFESVAAPGGRSPWVRGGALVGDSLLFRGIARQRLLQSEAAQADFVAAVNHNPKDPRPHDALARLALQLGAREVAREQFEAALAAAPNYGPARLGLALLGEWAGRPAQAAEDYRAALALAPRWRPARVRYGAALVAAGAYGQAAEVLRADAGTDDGLGRAAAFHLGTALFASGDARGALAQWEAVGGDDLKPHIAMARDRVARSVLASDPGAARVLWQRALSEHPLPPYRGALHEAALREAAVLLLVGRDVPEARERAGKALDFARLLYASDGSQRTERVQAMLALANGDVQALPTQVESSAPLRDRCHALAGLVLQEQTRQAVTALALIPQENAGEAMPARLRALVAELTGDWRLALDSHLRSLISPAPALAATTLVSACGGCGRENGPVFAVEKSESARCVTCLRIGLAAVLDCARRAGAIADVEQVFTEWTEALGGAADAAGVGTALGLLRAESDDYDAALALLTADTPVERAAVLVRRAAVDVRRGKATRGVVDLREAVTLAPGDGPAAEALALLGEHEAFVNAGEGRLREAFDGYVAALLGDPGSPRLLHAVGLTGYRLASGMNASRSPEVAADVENVWSWTLGALVAGVYSPDVWGQTASVSGRSLAPGQVGKARGLLIERLGDDLRALDVAAGRSGREVGAWSTRVGMELRCAEAFAQEDLRITLGEGPARRLILGPALLRLLTAANAEAADGRGRMRARTARMRTSPPPRSPTGSPDTSRPWPPTRTARSARR
jgi:tetratricopeptide (TPR) repeat protein